MNVSFSQYINLIGKGKKASKSLTQSQALDAMKMALGGQVSQAQLGAFLMLLRMREETVDELAGFLSASREQIIWHQAFKKEIDLDIGCYAGKRRHLPWLALAILLLAQQGYRIAVHGTPEPTAKRLYMHDVFAEFNWPIAQDEAQFVSLMNIYGFCFTPLRKVNPALDTLIQMRSELGLRSCANSLARMLNPMQARRSLHGVYHRHFDEKHVEVASRLSDSNVICIRGDAGEPEVNPERGCKIYQFANGQIRKLVMPALLPTWQIKPRELSPLRLKAVWEETAGDKYGEAATISTLALMLIQIENISVNDALQRAKMLWHGRSRQWLEPRPFNSAEASI